MRIFAGAPARMAGIAQGAESLGQECASNSNGHIQCGYSCVVSSTGYIQCGQKPAGEICTSVTPEFIACAK